MKTFLDNDIRPSWWPMKFIWLLNLWRPRQDGETWRVAFKIAWKLSLMNDDDYEHWCGQTRKCIEHGW